MNDNSENMTARILGIGAMAAAVGLFALVASCQMNADAITQQRQSECVSAGGTFLQVGVNSHCVMPRPVAE